MKHKAQKIVAFNLPTGRAIAKKYEVITKLGQGWEGEVYKIRELSTDIERAAKLFYPHRNVHDRTSKFYAKKLHKLQHCDILIKYHTEEQFIYKRVPVTVLVSQYVEGELLSEFIKTFPGQRLSDFQALHLLYALVCGIEKIHLANEYHGDLHSDNIIVTKFGLRFELKLVDLFYQKSPKRISRKLDILNLIYIFYEVLGGKKYYSKHLDASKYICCGLKNSLILERFPTLSRLREHIEAMTW